MDIQVSDFNGANDLFARGEPGRRWSELEDVLLRAPIFLQGSDQKGKVGQPIFDPKATNDHLTQSAAAEGWNKIVVPEELQMFGVDWDAGKGSILAEWQFSNYPFLWNNVIRTETVLHGGFALAGMDAVRGLVVVTKVGAFPSSNSTLYFEQAHAQLDAVMSSGTFDVPIRLVGLDLRADTTEIHASWSVYPGRYSRTPESVTTRKVRVTWGSLAKYGNRSARLALADD